MPRNKDLRPSKNGSKSKSSHKSGDVSLTRSSRKKVKREPSPSSSSSRSTSTSPPPPKKKSKHRSASPPPKKPRKSVPLNSDVIPPHTSPDLGSVSKSTTFQEQVKNAIPLEPSHVPVPSGPTPSPVGSAPPVASVLDLCADDDNVPPSFSATMTGLSRKSKSRRSSKSGPMDDYLSAPDFEGDEGFLPHYDDGEAGEDIWMDTSGSGSNTPSYDDDFIVSGPGSNKKARVQSSIPHEEQLAVLEYVFRESSLHWINLFGKDIVREETKAFLRQSKLHRSSSSSKKPSASLSKHVSSRREERG